MRLFGLDRTTSETELSQWCAANVKRFQKILCRDQPHLAEKDGGYIINLDTTDGAGTHWCGLWMDKQHGAAWWFDSFGYGPPWEYVRAHPDCNFGYSDVQHQELDQVNCGPRVVAWLQEMGAAPGPVGRKKFFARIVADD